MKSDECYTPALFLRAARKVLGRIDLDPASCAHAQRSVKARRFFSAKTDGLSKRWRGRVWMNPPYSRPAPWVAKLLEGFECGDVTEAIALLNARTGSAWFQSLSAHAWRCEKRKRIQFHGPGTGNGRTTHGFNDSCFFYLGPRPELFAAVFSEFGQIVPPTANVTLGVTDASACTVCGRSLAGRRADAVMCSVACKQRAYRKRQKAA